MRVGVPTYAQQRNLSCEYAALVMAMGAYGVWVSEYEFDDRVGWSENPHWGYRGDITGWWGNTDDYGVYAAALAPALADFGFWGEEFYAQGNPTALTARLDAGTPVLVWLGLWGDTGFYEYAADGTPVQARARFACRRSGRLRQRRRLRGRSGNGRHELLRLVDVHDVLERDGRHGSRRRPVLALSSPRAWDTPVPRDRLVGLVFDDRYLTHNTGLDLIEDRSPIPSPNRSRIRRARLSSVAPSTSWIYSGSRSACAASTLFAPPTSN